MNAKELLNPRFEIIADFPGSPFKVGEIWDATASIVNADDYPHLFRKLNWWENRKEEDMPKKLICKAIKDDTEVMDITEWDMKNLLGRLDENHCCNLRIFNPEFGYFPID